MDNTTYDDLGLEDEGSAAALAITVGAAIGGIIIGFFSGKIVATKSMQRKLMEHEKKIQDLMKVSMANMDDSISTPSPKAAAA